MAIYNCAKRNLDSMCSSRTDTVSAESPSILLNFKMYMPVVTIRIITIYIHPPAPKVSKRVIFEDVKKFIEGEEG
jgi:hypothetical protein